MMYIFSTKLGRVFSRSIICTLNEPVIISMVAHHVRDSDNNSWANFNLYFDKLNLLTIFICNLLQCDILSITANINIDYCLLIITVINSLTVQ